MNLFEDIPLHRWLVVGHLLPPQSAPPEIQTQVSLVITARNVDNAFPMPFATSEWVGRLARRF